MLVSICMITYNHEPFIRQAIEGVLMQKINFPYELIIADDCSKDKTPAICSEYANKYQQIRLIQTNSNIGMLPNFSKTLKACRGKYIALCEGDDYWTDPFKLQKQVDCLEQNPKAVFCFTSILELNRVNELRLIRQELNKSVYSIEDFILNQDYIGAATFLFKNIIYIPDWIYKLKTGDKFLIFQLAAIGESVYIDEPTAVYRNNGLGVHSSLSDTEKVNNIINDFRVFNKAFKYKYDNLFKESLKRSVKYIENSLSTNLAKPDYKSARRDIIVMCKILPFYKVILRIAISDLIKCILGNRISRGISSIKKSINLEEV
jgi:glycosyltransferase involved in cell wall biosynthesis